MFSNGFLLINFTISIKIATPLALSIEPDDGRSTKTKYIIGIEKYIPRALDLCNDFNLDDYTKQRMELIEEYVESLTNNPKIKQHKLSDFF
ncbi:unnamed protein product [marine sediment metagenome]|uniref:Uncharacterized protein n=1 Tax=marine sediment metagenome TaxID=412755 RepID=X1I663_9ZZZZ